MHEAYGPRARFEHFAADMLYAIAAKGTIDTDKTRRFGELLEDVYRNPFEKRKADPKRDMSASEIKDYLVQKIRKLREELEG